MTSRAHGKRGAGSGFLRALALASRVAAWLVVALVLLDCLAQGQARVELLAANGLVQRLMPAPLAGSFVVASPFGGAFRGDFALMAVGLLVLDWLLCRVSDALR